MQSDDVAIREELHESATSPSVDVDTPGDEYTAADVDAYYRRDGNGLRAEPLPSTSSESITSSRAQLSIQCMVTDVKNCS